VVSRLRAVGVGVGLALAVELGVFLLFGRVSVGGGLLGSAAAGWLGAGSAAVGRDAITAALRRGAVVGLSVACVVALVVVPAGVVLTLATGETRLVPFGLVVPGLGSPAAVAVVVGGGVTLPNALVGAAAAGSRLAGRD
jgi:hypothetical protein